MVLNNNNVIAGLLISSVVVFFAQADKVSVFRGGNGGRITQQASTIDCSLGQELFCPLAHVPTATFPAIGGSLSSDASTACCPAQYTQCQIQDNEQYCRVLMEYTISPSTANDIETCPETTPDCTCQQDLSSERFLKIGLCPETTECCATCTCYGDPHCRSFNASTSIWAVCDDRDSNCLHQETICNAQTYDGQSCKWLPNASPAYCSLPPIAGSEVPGFIMYEKTYQNYLNSSDLTEYSFSLELNIGVYGSITKVILTDTGYSTTPLIWYIDSNGACKSPSAYAWKNNLVSISNLPSMVEISLACFDGTSIVAQRIDVDTLLDPWYIVPNPHPVVETFGGYCVTTVIDPLVSGVTVPPVVCSLPEKQVALALGCKNSNLGTCRTVFCTHSYLKLSYVSLGNPTTNQEKLAACEAYVSNGGYLAAVCTATPAIVGGGGPYDPTVCLENESCAYCVNSLIDYPNLAKQILSGQTSPTSAPTITCPDLLTTGLARQSLIPETAGVEIDFYDTTTGLWTPIFALLDQEIAACGPCASILVNGSDASALSLLQAGSYRVRQCGALSSSMDQNLCTSAPAYGATVTYLNPFDGVATSVPYGSLVTQNKMVCNPTVYPNCPANYICCIWEGENPSWEACMSGYYGSDYAKKYPKCVLPTSAPSSGSSGGGSGCTNCGGGSSG